MWLRDQILILNPANKLQLSVLYLERFGADSDLKELGLLLTATRRNGFIENRGTRAQPIWWAIMPSPTD